MFATGLTLAAVGFIFAVWCGHVLEEPGEPGVFMLPFAVGVLGLGIALIIGSIDTRWEGYVECVNTERHVVTGAVVEDCEEFYKAPRREQ